MPRVRDYRSQEEITADAAVTKLVDHLLSGMATGEERVKLADELHDYVRAMIDVVKAEDRQRERAVRDY